MTTNFEELVAILFIAFVAILAGLMFLKGYFHEERNTRFRRVIDLDKVFFPNLQNRRVILTADQLAFLICIFTAAAILIAALLKWTRLMVIPHIVNYAAAWLLIGIVASWVMRYVFIYAYRNQPPHKIPRLWPFQNES